MRQCAIDCILIALTILSAPAVAAAQSEAGAAQETIPYGLKMSVDEVGLTFHAADEHGVSVNDLKLEELKLLDNGKPPRRVVAFHLTQDDPIRAGILIDTSESMTSQLVSNRAISTRYAQRVLRGRTDQAFVMDFGYVSKITQTWTSDPQALSAGIRQVVAGRENPLGGTALFDTIFRACFHVFGKADPVAAEGTVRGNFILLFSDGEDNASHTSLKDVVDVCQRANTAIYVFRSEPNPSLFSSGPRTLTELAKQTGGRVFAADDPDAAIDADLRVIDADLRSQYRLIYNPAELKHDGSFHRIELKAPERVESMTVRSGYYDRPR
jgi:VWFA-related protein